MCTKFISIVSGQEIASFLADFSCLDWSTVRYQSGKHFISRIPQHGLPMGFLCIRNKHCTFFSTDVLIHCFSCNKLYMEYLNSTLVARVSLCCIPHFSFVSLKFIYRFESKCRELKIDIFGRR